VRSIDVHAHVTPQCVWRATENGGSWHTLRREQDARGQDEKDAILWKNPATSIGV
jgi:hypothetical protein